MRYLCIVLAAYLITGCTQAQETEQVPAEDIYVSKGDPFASETFEDGKIIFYSSNADTKEDREKYADEIVPWVYLVERENQFGKIIGKEDLVINSREAILFIQYPLYSYAEIEIKAQGEDGFRRRELIDIISREYQRIYKEEEESAQTKPVSYQTLRGIEKHGKYGIWGDGIDKLFLTYVAVSDTNSVKPKLKLMVGFE